MNMLGRKVVEVPEELWEKICRDAIFIDGCEHLCLATAISLSGTCKQLRRLVLPLIYGNVSFGLDSEIVKFSSVLRDMPERARLVKSFRIIGPSSIASRLPSVLKEIGSQIAPSLEKFTYDMYQDDFTSYAFGCEEDWLCPFLHKTKAIHLYYQRNRCRDPRISAFETLLQMASYATKVEELILIVSDGLTNDTATFPEGIIYLPPTLTRLVISIEPKPNRMWVAKYYAAMMSSLNTLEELVMPTLYYGDRGLDALVHYFGFATSSLRKLYISASGVPRVSVSAPGYEDWENKIIALISACNGLTVLHLAHAVRHESRLFRHLPEGLETLCIEFERADSRSTYVAEAFIAAVKSWAIERRGKLRKIRIAHGLGSISKDSNTEVEEYLKQTGAQDVRFVCGPKPFTFWKCFKVRRSRALLSQARPQRIETFYTFDSDINTFW